MFINHPNPGLNLAWRFIAGLAPSLAIFHGKSNIFGDRNIHVEILQRLKLGEDQKNHDLSNKLEKLDVEIH